MPWVYETEVVDGNFFDVAKFLSTQHPDWDVVAVEHVERVEAYTNILYRVHRPEVSTKDSSKPFPRQ